MASVVVASEFFLLPLSEGKIRRFDRFLDEVLTERGDDQNVENGWLPRGIILSKIMEQKRYEFWDRFPVWIRSCRFLSLWTPSTALLATDRENRLQRVKGKTKIEIFLIFLKNKERNNILYGDNLNDCRNFS
jgi:hypothetical protein